MLALARAARRDGGSALISAILMSAVVIVLGMTMLAISTHTNRSSTDDRTRDQVLHAADAAVSRVTQDLGTNFQVSGACGGPVSPPVTMADSGSMIAKYRYRVEGAAGDPGCTQNLRLIRAWGYSPSGRIVRQLEVTVSVVPVGGFTYTLFAGTNALDMKNNASITGNVYAKTLSAAWNSLNVQSGDILTPGDATIKNNDVVKGRITAGGSVTLGNNSTVTGSVTAATGSVTLGSGCTVTDYIRAGTTITGTCSPSQPPASSYVPNSPSTPPAAIPLPTYAYDASAYIAAGTVPIETTTTLANTTFASSPFTTNAKGVYHVVADATATAATPGVIDLKRDVKITGPLTIVADTNVAGVAPKIKISGTWTSTCTCQFVLVTRNAGADAILIDNPNLDLPTQTLTTLFFTPGEIHATQKVDHFYGSMYAGSITVKNNLTIQASTDLAQKPPLNFTFPTSSVTQWDVRPLQNGWHEVPGGPLPAGS